MDAFELEKLMYENNLDVQDLYTSETDLRKEFATSSANLKSLHVLLVEAASRAVSRPILSKRIGFFGSKAFGCGKCNRNFYYKPHFAELMRKTWRIVNEENNKELFKYFKNNPYIDQDNEALIVTVAHKLKDEKCLKLYVEEN